MAPQRIGEKIRREKLTAKERGEERYNGLDIRFQWVRSSDEEDENNTERMGTASQEEDSSHILHPPVREDWTKSSKDEKAVSERKVRKHKETWFHVEF